MSRRKTALWALCLFALTACADLEPIAERECGNGVVDVGEDCDSFERLGMQCHAPGSDGECHFSCSEPGACAPGYGCGQDFVCRAATGWFELEATISDPANVIIPADFDGNGETDLLASSPFGLVLSYQNGDFEEDDTVDLNFASESAVVAAGQLTDDVPADIAYLNLFESGLGVVRGSEDQTFAGTVYPTLSIPSEQAQIFALEGDPLFAGQEPMAVIDLPTTGTVVVRVSISSGQEPEYFLSDPHTLPALDPGSLAPVRSGYLDPTKPCEQYVLVFRDQAWVGTPCQDDGQVNGSYTSTGEPPSEPVPIPVSPVDFTQCKIKLDRGFILDVDADEDLDILLTPREPLEATPCVVRGPLALSSNMTTPLVAESYPLFALNTDSYGEVERVLEVNHLDSDTTPDFVTSESIFTSYPGETCPIYLAEHYGGSALYCSTLGFDSPTTGTYVSAALGDVNGDDVLDVALAAGEAGQVLVHVGAGDGTYAVHAVEAEGSPELLVLGDVDADGLDDLMFADRVCDENGFCVDPNDDSDILTIAFGRANGGLEEPRSLGRLHSIERLGTARFPGQSWGLDAALDVGVLARDPVDHTLSFAIMYGDTRRELQAPFFLGTPRDDPDDGLLLANGITLALGRFVEPVDGDVLGPAWSDARHVDIAVAAYDGSDEVVYDGSGSGADEPGGGGSPPQFRLWLLDSEGEAKLSTSRAWPGDAPLGEWEGHSPVFGALVAGNLDDNAADEVVYASGRGLAIGRVAVEGHPFFQVETLEIDLSVTSTVYIPREFLFEADASAIGAGPVPLQLGDLDGDAQRDIVLSGATADGEAQLLVLWNDGGRFSVDNSSTLDLPPGTSTYLLLNVNADVGLEVLVA
ncbi:MAG TPA: VCBS repeat-containing protein, partial [Polyangiaceae bacterium]|nr:VCBS repeat-containing protein [Polyangiaceae bacterium]